MFFGRLRPIRARGRTPTLSARRAISGPSSSICANPETHPNTPVMGTFGWSPGVFWMTGTYVPRNVQEKAILAHCVPCTAHYRHPGPQWATCGTSKTLWEMVYLRLRPRGARGRTPTLSACQRVTLLRTYFYKRRQESVTIQMYVH